jgi:4-oxalmesaconate hydratase
MNDHRMIIDWHGQYTTAPKALPTWRDAQIAALADPARVAARGTVGISDDEIRESLEHAQLKLQRQRGTDVTIFSPRASAPANCIGELTRCVNELGFIGCNLNPDPSGGHWTAPPLTDRYWYPLYEAMVDLDVPAMVHVSSSCNPNFHGLDFYRFRAKLAERGVRYVDHEDH